MQKRTRFTKQNIYFAVSIIATFLLLLFLLIRTNMTPIIWFLCPFTFFAIICFSRWLYPTKKTFRSFVFYLALTPASIVATSWIWHIIPYERNLWPFFSILIAIFLFGDLLLRVLFNKIPAMKKGTSFRTKEIAIKNSSFALLEFLLLVWVIWAVQIFPFYEPFIWHLHQFLVFYGSSLGIF